MSATQERSGSDNRVVFFKHGDVVAEAAGQAVSYDGMVGYLDEMIKVPHVCQVLVVSVGDRRAGSVASDRQYEVLPRPKGNLLSRLLGYFTMWREEMRLVSQFRPDLVVALDVGYHCAALYSAAQRAGAKFVLGVPGQVTGARNRDRVREMIVRWVSRRPRTVSVLARGEYLAGELLQARVPADKITVFYPRYCAEGLPDVPDLSPDSASQVVFVGRLSEVKGISDLPEVVQAMTAVEDAKLVVVGDGPLRGELEAALRAYPTTLWEMRGGLPHQSVLQELGHAAVVVVPSRFEGIAKTVMEAVIMGRPVVAYDVGGIGDWVHDGVNGYLVAAGDVDALCARTVDLLRDPGARARMGAASLVRGLEILGLEPTFSDAVGQVIESHLDRQESL